MKVLFLDIDGVCNCEETITRHKGFIGIDPVLAFRAGKILLDTGADMVLSSTWRLMKDGKEEISQRVHPFVDVTPEFPGRPRGEEIKFWLDMHPEVDKYAILDDDGDMLDEQKENFFQTTWKHGLTEEIAKKVTEHLK